MKRLLVVLSTLSLAICAKAEACQSSFDGLYLGIAGGGSFTTGEETTAISDTYLFTAIPNFHNWVITGNDDVAKNTLKGLIKAGYGYTWEMLYLGAEIYGSLSNYDMGSSKSGEFIQASVAFFNQTSVNNTVDMRSGEYGIDFRPGLLITPTTLLYGRLGAAFNKLTMTSNNTTNEQYFPPAFTPEELPASLVSSNEKNVTGLRIGGGLEQRIGQHFSIEADYIFTDYGDIVIDTSSESTTTSVNRGPALITLDTSNKVKVTNNTVLLGLSYYFQAPKDGCCCCCSNDYFGLGGFYIGLSGGGSFTKDSQTVSATHDFVQLPAFTQELPLMESNQLTKNAPAGAIEVGYGLIYHRLYLAPEAFVKISDYEMNSTASNITLNNGIESSVITIYSTDTVNTNTKLNPVEYGIDLLPGFLVTPHTLVFARVGTAVNKLTLNATSTVTFQELPPLIPQTFAVSVTPSDSKTVAALRLGGGIEQAISKHFSIRADYIYTDYGDISVSGATDQQFTSADFGGIVLAAGNTTTARVTNNTVLLGLFFR